MAREGLLHDLRDFGVTRVEFVAAFPQPAFEVIVSPDTDAQAGELWSSVGRERVLRGLLAAGFVEDDLREVAVRIISQQAVDRDYEGSWFYALR